jgi:hypothetical protein
MDGGGRKGVEKAISFALSRKAISATRLAFQTALHSPSLYSLKNQLLLVKTLTVFQINQHDETAMYKQDDLLFL